DAGLAALREPERRGEELAGLRVEVDFELVGVGLAVLPGEFRLGVEQVHLARAAVLEQADDGPGRGGVVRRARRERGAGGGAGVGGWGGGWRSSAAATWAGARVRRRRA